MLLSLSVLLSAYCDLHSFAFLNGLPQGRVFSVLVHSPERHKWSFVRYIVSFFALEISFSEPGLAKYHCLHKKPYIFHVFSYHRTCLQFSLLQILLYCTNLSQVVLRRFYMERFLCNTICVTLICLISSFHTNLKRRNSSDLLRIVSSTFQCRKLPRFRNLHVQIS